MTSVAAVLTGESVEAIFRDCLFREGEDQTNNVQAEGIMFTAAFHPSRLTEHKPAIEAMLSELPDSFKRTGGGGMSFLNACMDRHDNQWTGLHAVMGMLFQLGIAIGKVKCILPRAMWGALPGGMPYYVVDE